jgi:hypothetical protein
VIRICLLLGTCLSLFFVVATNRGDEKSSAVTVPSPAIVQQFKLAPFYKKYLDAQGLPILASAKVPDAAMGEAADIVNHMLQDREDVRQAMIKNKVRVAVMAATEKTTDIPEHSDLTPKDYWDKRARGLGATFVRPAVSGAAENLLNLPGDRYARENILVHEFAHAMHEMGLNSLDKSFDDKLRSIYQSALDRKLWQKTYAATNHKEYWAEGVQSYFDTNDANNAQHNDINTRDKLEKYDPGLFGIIDEVFHHSAWRYVRYAQRHPASQR